jgi:NHL repeat
MMFRFVLPLCARFGLMGLMGLMVGASLLAPQALAVPVEVLVGSAKGRTNSQPPASQVNEPFSVDFDAKGTAYGVEFTRGNRVFRLGLGVGQRTEFLAGEWHVSGEKTPETALGDGPKGMAARFNGLHDIAISSDGIAYLADTFNHRIRALDLKTGAVSTIAGTGAAGFSGDGGPALAATFKQPYCAGLSPDGAALFIADIGNVRVRAVDLKTGLIRTVVGSGQRGLPSDGVEALAAPLIGPRACCVAKDGTLYVVLREGNAVVAVKDGHLKTVVNRSGQKGAMGDGGPALEAQLNGPKYLCMDAQQRVLIADTENHVIRRFDPVSGQISLVAGRLGKPGSAVGEDLLSTELRRPHGVRTDAQGRLLITDSENDRILRGMAP